MNYAVEKDLSDGRSILPHISSPLGSKVHKKISVVKNDIYLIQNVDPVAG